MGSASGLANAIQDVGSITRPARAVIRDGERTLIIIFAFTCTLLLVAVAAQDNNGIPLLWLISFFNLVQGYLDPLLLFTRK